MYEIEQHERRGVGFVISIVWTVILGVGGAVAALHHFRQPMPEIVHEKAEPIIKYIEKVVNVPVDVVQEIHTDPTPPPPPEVNKPGPFDGEWRLRNGPLPLIQIRHKGSMGLLVSGSYTPANWSGVYEFRDGVAGNRVAHFSVADKLHRVQVRMTLLNSAEAKVETWISPEDMPQIIASYSKPGVIRSQQEALLVQFGLARELKRLGKVVNLGVFKRIADPGRESK